MLLPIRWRISRAPETRESGSVGSDGTVNACARSYNRKGIPMTLRSSQDLAEQVEALYADLARYTLNLHTDVYRADGNVIESEEGTETIVPKRIPRNIYIALSDLILSVNTNKVTDRIVRSIKRLLRPNSPMLVDLHTISLTYRKPNGETALVPLIWHRHEPSSIDTLPGKTLLSDPNVPYRWTGGDDTEYLAKLDLEEDEEEPHHPETERTETEHTETESDSAVYYHKISRDTSRHIITVQPSSSTVEVNHSYLYQLQCNALLSLLIAYLCKQPEEIYPEVSQTVQRILEVIGVERMEDVPVAYGAWLTLNQSTRSRSHRTRTEMLAYEMDSFHIMVPHNRDTMLYTVSNNLTRYILASLRIASTTTRRQWIKQIAARYPLVNVLSDVHEAVLSGIPHGNDEDYQRVVDTCVQHARRLLEAPIAARDKLPMKHSMPLKFSYDGACLAISDNMMDAFSNGKAFVKIRWTVGSQLGHGLLETTIVDSTTSISCHWRFRVEPDPHTRIDTISIVLNDLQVCCFSREQMPGTHAVRISNIDTQPDAIYVYKPEEPDRAAQRILPTYWILYPTSILVTANKILNPHIHAPALLQISASEVEQELLRAAHTPQQKLYTALRLAANSIRIHRRINSAIVRTVLVRYSKTLKDWVSGMLLVSTTMLQKPFRRSIPDKLPPKTILDSVLPYLSDRDARYVRELCSQLEENT